MSDPERSSLPASFQDYAEGMKPLLDAGFSSYIDYRLGDGLSRPRSEEVMRVFGGGKRIRGSLLCLIAEALGGTIENALSRAIAVELIQTATLIHDDFVDQHESRRNLPAVWTLEGARKAVLLGDVIFASAIQMMSELGRDDGLIVSRAIVRISLGAYREPMNPSLLIAEIESDHGGSSLYEKIISLKTGVLFGAACRLGAVAAGADEKLRQEWHSYGSKIGEAYQIADDLHEIERHLLIRSMKGSELTSIAPALLFFSEEGRFHILDALRQESFCLKKEMLMYLEGAAEIMKKEIERRLQSAIAGIAEYLPTRKYDRLIQQAPWDVIRMFNEKRAESSVSLR